MTEDERKSTGPSSRKGKLQQSLWPENNIRSDRSVSLLIKKKKKKKKHLPIFHASSVISPNCDPLVSLLIQKVVLLPLNHIALDRTCVTLMGCGGNVLYLVSF